MKSLVKNLIFLLLFNAIVGIAYSQEEGKESSYKKRVLESTEIDILSSYYTQDGDNAAVSGGIGTEKLVDYTPTIVVSIPLNDDDFISIDAGISAFSSASASNIDPFDGRYSADPFVESTGASTLDTWYGFTGSYNHSSDDRNNIVSAKVSIASEFDYFSVGFGGSYSRLFNEKNTELGVHANVYLDKWYPLYPIELESFEANGGVIGYPFNKNVITGNTDYNPNFESFSNEKRNSYSLGLSFSQILSKSMQGSLLLDLVYQEGLLSTPFQRVYFSDIEDSYIDNFALADDVEQLPGSRFKVALGSRLNYYINEFLVVRTYYRFYTDDWGIKSHTASIELPVKLSFNFTIYPSFRFYNQTQADYFAPFNRHLSTEDYYTSDYDLSEFYANQYGIGISYTDILTNIQIGKIGFKSLDVKYDYYERNTGFKANIISGGLRFIIN